MLGIAHVRAAAGRLLPVGLQRSSLLTFQLLEGLNVCCKLAWTAEQP